MSCGSLNKSDSCTHWLFYTLRLSRREARLEKTKGNQQTGSRPTDIHNYTGWQQAGRSRTMDTTPETIETDADDA